MLRFFIIKSYIILLTTLSYAHFDHHASFQSRTHAAALSNYYQAGFSQLIWGSSDSFLYGFVRPFVYGSLSPTSTEGRYGIELYPISFLGLEAKKAYGQRFKKLENSECEIATCLGKYNYTDVTLQMYLGYQNYFTSLRWTRSFFDSQDDQSKPVLDYSSHVFIAPHGDTGDYYSLSLGSTGEYFSKKIDIGFYFQDFIFKKYGQRQSAGYLFVQSDLKDYGFEKTHLTMALGAFESSILKKDFSFYLSLKHNFKKAIGFGR